MKNIDEKIAKSIYALNGNSDFLVFTSWLKESLQEEYSISDDINDVNEDLKSKGKRQALKEILTEINEAITTLERFEKNRK